MNSKKFIEMREKQIQRLQAKIERYEHEIELAKKVKRVYFAKGCESE